MQRQMGKPTQILNEYCRIDYYRNNEKSKNISIALMLEEHWVEGALPG